MYCFSNSLWQSVNGFLTKQTPTFFKWCTVKSRFFFIGGLRQFGNMQETVDYKACPSSSTVVISGCHTSHIITHDNFKMCAFLGLAPQICSLLAPTSGLA